MERLLLDLSRVDCRAAAWALVAGNAELGAKLLARAEQFLRLRRGSMPWRPVVTAPVEKAE